MSLPSVLVVLLLAAAGGEDVQGAAEWPSFRGPRASGVMEGAKTQVRWSEPKWKVAIPGLGHSSPVVAGDRIFVTTAVTESGDESLKTGLYGSIQSVQDHAEYSWEVICLDRKDGSVRWRKTAHEGIPRIKRHPKASHANSTPATDGKHVVSFFGAEGLYCHDTEGKLLWKKDFSGIVSGFFAVPSAEWGFGNSPVTHEGKVLVQCDVLTNSFIAAYQVEDGKEIWRTPRSDVPTWSTPTVCLEGSTPQVVVNGFKETAGYHLESGEQLWKLSGAGDIPVPTPIVAHGLIFTTSAHGRLSPIYAIRPDAKGDITLEENETRNEGIAWSIPRGGNYMQTPIVVGDYLYACKDNGVVTCFEAKTGKEMFSERLGKGRSGFTASPVAANGRIYFTSEDGIVHVLQAGPEFKVIATNDLGETCMATPAIMDNGLLFRTRNHVVFVEGK